MANLSLYHCAQEVIDAIESCVDHESGEIIDQAKLDNAIGHFKNKGAHVAAYTLNLRETAAAAKAHAKTVAKRAKSIEAKADRLEAYIRNAMQAADIHEIAANDGTFTVKLLRDRDEAVEIAEGAPIDERFERITIKKEWDKAALTKAIKAGEPVPDCVALVKRDRLEIK